MITIVSCEAPDGLVLPLEVLLDDPNNGLLHFLLEDVVLALSVHLVEELFLHLFELLVLVLARQLLVLLQLRYLLLE